MKQKYNVRGTKAIKKKMTVNSFNEKGVKKSL